MDELNMKQPAPVTPKPELPAHHVSKSLKVLMLVFAVMLVGGLGYLVWYQNTTSDTTEETIVTTKKTTGTTSTTTGSGTTATTTTTDAAADWTTYTNATYGYNFKYPSTWTVSDTNGDKTEIAVKDSSDSTKNIVISSSATTQTLAQIIQAKTTSLNIKDSKAITFKTLSAYEALDLGMSNYYSVLTVKNSKLYQITFPSCTDETTAACKAALTANQNLFLTNFTFTN